MKRSKNISMLIMILLALYFYSCEKDEPTNTDSHPPLAEIINAYRVELGLSKIPISRSLTTVAETHVKDLANNQPNGGDCNMHSWSDKGSWTACCYTGNHAQAECMWNKPSELTSYRGEGYEIAAWSSSAITAKQALSIWQESEAHHNVILNKDIWENAEWKAIGSAIYEGYAVVWFGKEIDTNK